MLGANPRALASAPWVSNLLDSIAPGQSVRVLAALRQLDRIYASIGADAKDQPELLVLVEGDFSRGIPAALRDLPGRIYRVSPRAVLAGPPAPVMQAMARVRQKAGPAPEQPDGDLWAEVHMAGFPAKAMVPDEFRGIVHAALRLDLQQGVRAKFEVQAQSPQVAAKLLAELRKKIGETPGAQQVADQLVIAAEDNKIRVEASLSPADLEAAFGPGGQRLFSSRAPAPPRKAIVYGQTK
jgi:hypothetical protein